MSYYREDNEDMSIVSYLKSAFSAYPFVSVIMGFQVNNLTVPSVSIHPLKIDCPPIEIGNGQTDRIRVYQINIYANSDIQRSQFSYTVLNLLDGKIPVYNYNEGFPPDNSPSIIDYLNITEKQLEFYPVYPELVDDLYYRTVIDFVTRRSLI